MSATKRVSGDYTIKAVGTGAGIKLVSEKVVSESHINLKKLSLAPETDFDYNAIFAADSGAGGTGLYYAGDSDTDELVSKRKAILFSLLF